jgi:hypothetical protein
MKSLPTIRSENKEWGFYGTSKRNFGLSDEDTQTLFEVAAKLNAINDDKTISDTIEFLDSRQGRHYADSLTFFKPNPNGFKDVLEALVQSCS